jgi:hypothetical protein
VELRKVTRRAKVHAYPTQGVISILCIIGCGTDRLGGWLYCAMAEGAMAMVNTNAVMKVFSMYYVLPLLSLG